MSGSSFYVRWIVVSSLMLIGRPGISAEWIWGTRDQSSFEISVSVKVPQDAQQIKLKAAVDSSTLKIQWNHRTWLLKPEVRIAEWDLTEALGDGQQQLQLQANSVGGPAGIAFEIYAMQETGERVVLAESMSSLTDAVNGSKAYGYGRVAIEPWWEIARKPKINAFDEYNQWKEAKHEGHEASFQLSEGFEIELIFQGEGSHESWVSMEVGPDDQIFLGNERVGVHRLPAPSGKRESIVPVVINESLKGVQGLLRIDDELWVSANRSKALFRLTSDEDGNRWGKVEKILETEGSEGDHGRHDVELDLQQRMYVIHGDSIKIPGHAKSLVPITHEFEDGVAKVGHVLRFNRAGDDWEVFCSGLRNPYGLALNQDQELFTFDADAERHTGLPWYRPTRIIHLMAGVDYGWRHPENPWPSYLPDTVPPIAKIGRGSPTALKFGYDSNFPAPYGRALFALDWSYGRVLAVHLVPNGASYTGHAEVFLSGRPFSVCDLGFLSDGSMLVLTGGRDTPSSIYRVRHQGLKTRVEQTPQVIARERHAKKARARRQSLEARFGEQGKAAVDAAWVALADPDPAIRSAARILLERQPVESWLGRALRETNIDVALQSMLALTRVGPREQFFPISERLQKISWTSPEQVQVACRIQSLIDVEMAGDELRATAIRERFEPCFPTGVSAVDRELSRLLIHHDSIQAVGTSLELCADSQVQVDRFHYLVCLAEASVGWNSARFDEYFRLLEGAQRFLTDEGLDARIRRMHDKVLEWVPLPERQQYASLFQSGEEPGHVETQRPLHQNWTVNQVLEALGSTEYVPDRQNGAAIFKAASCSRCHRFGTAGRAFGPDLTTVMSRFGRRHLIEQLIEPSKTISSQYQNYQFVLEDGRTITGQVVYDGFRKSLLRVATDPMNLQDVIEIQKAEIETVQPSPVSPMPERLLDSFSIREISDLLAFLAEGPAPDQR